MSNDILDIIEALNLNNILFVGHSISSMIGMLASIEKPAYFKKIIMIGPSPCYLNDGDYRGGFEQSDTPIAMNNPEVPKLSQELEQTFMAANPVIARQFAEVTLLSDYRDDLAKMNIPTLINSIVPIEVGEYLYLNEDHYLYISHPGETIRGITFL